MILAASMVMSSGVTTFADDDHDLFDSDESYIGEVQECDNDPEYTPYKESVEVRATSDSVKENVGSVGDGGVNAESYNHETDEVKAEVNVKTEYKGNGNVKGGVAAYSGSESGSASSTVTVDGDVGKGIKAQSYGNGTTTVTVDGNVGEGIYATSMSDGKSSTTVIVDGNVGDRIETLSQGFAGGTAATTINVGGNVDKGIYTESSNNGVTTVTVDGSTGDITAQSYWGASTEFTIKDSVNVSGTESTGIQIFAMDSPSFEESNPNSTVKITVVKDVKSTGTTGTAVRIGSETNGNVELTVGGEISGGEHNIVVGEEVSLDKVNITVWKVDTSDGKNVVDKADDSQYVEAEKTINYIIKADSKDAQIAMRGTTRDGDYNVAKQDDRVYFKVDIPSGYSAEFYDVNGNSAYQIIPDGDGGAYISVPRGGGVYVGVRLTRTSTDSDSYSGSGSDSDSDYWSSGNNDKGNVGGLYAGFEALQGLQVHSTILGGSDVAQNIADVLTPVDTLSAMNNFEGTSIASIDMNNVMGAGVVNFNNMFVNSISDTVDVPVPANVVANQSYTVMFSDGTSIVVPCLMNGVLSIPFKKGADGLTYIICKTEVNPSMFMGMPSVGGWTY